MWFYLVPYLIGALSATPLVVLWFFPKLIVFVTFYLLALSGILFWSLWEPGKFYKAFWPWINILLFWLASLLMFIFIEGDVYRVIFILLVGVLSAWYLYGWLISSSQLLEVNRGAGMVATLTMSWLSVFLISTSANLLIIYLSFSYWILFEIYLLSIILLSLSLGWVLGWKIREHWRYLLTLLLIQAQFFLAFNWLPVTSYIIGWFLSIIFFSIFLLARFDTGLTISRRSLVYYLLSLGIASFLLLFTIRWI